MKASLTLLLLFITSLSFSQECQVKNKKDWARVEIRTLETVTTPEGYNFIGENIMMKVFANTLEDLSDKQLQKIKKDVANFGACVVYIDFNNLMQVDYGLYYVWTDEAGVNRD